MNCVGTRLLQLRASPKCHTSVNACDATFSFVRHQFLFRCELQASLGSIIDYLGLAMQGHDMS